MKNDYKFTKEEMELIISGLGGLPWMQVNNLIFNIQEQTKAIKNPKDK